MHAHEEFSSFLLFEWDDSFRVQTYVHRIKTHVYGRNSCAYAVSTLAMAGYQNGRLEMNHT
jgi:hypothetical protein